MARGVGSGSFRFCNRRGHDVVAMDLPTDDATATCETFADVVCAALDGCSDDVVVVGHSYGGMVIPLVAASRPVRHLVYLCAYVPEIGRSLNEQLRDDPESFNPAAYEGLTRDAHARSVWIDERLACEMMYADCEKDIAEAAIKRLRPHSTHPNESQFSPSLARRHGCGGVCRRGPIGKARQRRRPLC